GAATLGATLALLTLTRGYVVPATLAVALLLCALWAGPRVWRRMLLVSFPLALAILIPWFAAIHAWTPGGSGAAGWLEWNARQFGMPTAGTTKYLFTYVFWYSWPAWPFALWALYAWRHQFGALHIRL